MRWMLAAAALLLVPGTGYARFPGRPPLYDPVFLNIGFVCQWQSKCMDRQKDAMRRALKYVARARPPLWRVELCNRNAGRGRSRVDWIGYDNCIRNAALRPPPPQRTFRKRRRNLV